MRRAFFGGFLGGVVSSACGPSAPPPTEPVHPVVVAPVVSPPSTELVAIPAPAASAPSIQPDLPNAASWRDAEVVKRLANDCKWSPLHLARSSEEQRHPMACALQIVQACSPDPCFEDAQDKCKPACTQACDSCAGRCTASCESCKSACKDDACRSTCAVGCGDCRQKCVEEVDRCDTGTCNAQVAQCNKQLSAELKKPTCKAACSRAEQCMKPCGLPNGSNDACIASCRAKLASACPEKAFDLCWRGGH